MQFRITPAGGTAMTLVSVADALKNYDSCIRGEQRRGHVPHPETLLHYEALKLYAEREPHGDYFAFKSEFDQWIRLVAKYTPAMAAVGDRL